MQLQAQRLNTTGEIQREEEILTHRGELIQSAQGMCEEVLKQLKAASAGKGTEKVVAELTAQHEYDAGLIDDLHAVINQISQTYFRRESELDQEFKLAAGVRIIEESTVSQFQHQDLMYQPVSLLQSALEAVHFTQSSSWAAKNVNSNLSNGYRSALMKTASESVTAAGNHLVQALGYFLDASNPL